MYIDAKKFDYEKLGYPDAERLVTRDKEFARDSYRKWMEGAANDIVERQWEVVDVGAIEQVGDFVKLLKEAEFTYSLGAYTSAIALVGVCAEDLCRFFATAAGHNLDSQSQHGRVNMLANLGVITQDTSHKFHHIRQLRNDCLHYNTGFKQKDTSALKADALSALNSLKEVYASIAGVVDYKTIDPSRVTEMITAITSEAVSTQLGGLGIDDAVARTRNLFGSALGVDLSMNSGGPVYKTSIFKVEGIDVVNEPPELSLIDLTSGMIVIIDITDTDILALQKDGIGEGDIIATTVMSLPNKLDLTSTWRLWSTIKKMG